MNRLAFSHGHELRPYGATAVAVTPGWLQSEMMLDNFGVTESAWRAALDPARAQLRQPVAPGDFGLSESPRYIGRALAALAADSNRARWNQCSVTSGQLAREYLFTDLDGSRPDIWRYIQEVREPGLSTPTSISTANSPPRNISIREIIDAVPQSAPPKPSSRASANFAANTQQRPA